MYKYLLMIERYRPANGEIEIERVRPYFESWGAVVEMCRVMRDTHGADAFIIVKAHNYSALDQFFDLLGNGMEMDDIMMRVPGLLSLMRTPTIPPNYQTDPTKVDFGNSLQGQMGRLLGLQRESTKGTAATPPHFLTPGKLSIEPVEPEPYKPNEEDLKRWTFAKLMVERGHFSEGEEDADTAQEA